MSRSRSWTFTLNNPRDEEEERLLEAFEKGVVSYLVYGREVGKQCGTPHFQGYLHLVNTKTITAVKKCFGQRFHFEIKRGTHLEASNYCKKDDPYYTERGVLPKDPIQKGASERERWDAIREAAVRGDWDDIPSSEFIRNYGALRRINRDFGAPMVTNTEEVTGEWYWGPPNTGKSWKARSDHPDAYIKMANKWWDGYQGEDVVVLDELELNDCLGHHLKIWLDKYPFQAEYKGGSMLIRPKKIIITSNYSIDEIFGRDAMMTAAIKRRCKVTHFDANFNRHQ